MNTFSTFDKEYFFLSLPDDVCIPSLGPDQDTANKPYLTEKLPFGQKPLIFHNDKLEFSLARGCIPADSPPDVLFDGDDLVVRGYIAKNLEDMEIPHLAIQPAIYIDHKKKWHEDYWFLTFTKRFDCWDKKLSKYDPKPKSWDSSKFNVYATVLNAELLHKTPLRERLLFKMGGQTTAPVLVHQSIVNLFSVEGVNVISVEEEAKESGLLDEAEQ